MKAWLAVLVQATVCVSEVAFVAPPRWEAVEVPSHGVSSPMAQQSPSPSTSGLAKTLLLGAFVASALSRIRTRRSSIQRRVWITNLPPLNSHELPGCGADSRGRRFKLSHMLKKTAHQPMGRNTKKAWKNTVLLQKENLWCYTYGKFAYWQPELKETQMYTGPESHKDNPYFPAASANEAAAGWKPAALSTSMAKGSSSAFVAGNRPSFNAHRFTRPAAATVMKAHKKAAASSKNQGNKKHRKHWSIKFRQGTYINKDNVISSSNGRHWHPGRHVRIKGNHKIYATKEGIVQWRGPWNHREVTVVPMNFVEERCDFDKKILYPKVYEPWMGNAYRKMFYTKFGYTGKKRHTRCHILSKQPVPCMQDAKWVGLYEDWKESPAGIAHALKKEEKKKKGLKWGQKIRKLSTFHLVRKGKLQPPGELQTAGGDSESEAEA